MIKNGKGFTLLELLIAAAIIGVLSVLATQAFRRSSSDVRMQDVANRAAAVAVAARRYYVEYPGAASLHEAEVGAFGTPGACNPTEINIQNLVNCGFLEYRQWAAERKKSDGTYTANFRMWIEIPVVDGIEYKKRATVCYQGQGKILDQATYCSDGERVTVKSGD